MIGTKEIKTHQYEEVISVICDYCKKDIPVDSIEGQEIQRIDFIGGYGSVFGDGIRVRVDICQDCLRDHIGEYIKLYDPETGDELK